MSQHATELCTALVYDAYGALASRTFSTLCSYGRLSFSSILHRTMLKPIELKNSLALLVQQNLVFWYTAYEYDTAYYEANLEAAYNLVQVGKALDLIEERIGQSAAVLLCEVHRSGSCCIQDLLEAMLETPSDHLSKDHEVTKTKVVNGTVNGTSSSTHTSNIARTFVSDLQRLVREGYLQISHESHLRSASDNRRIATGTLRGSQAEETMSRQEKASLQGAVNEVLESWAFGSRQAQQSFLKDTETIASGNSLKRSRHTDEIEGQAEKRRKLNNHQGQVNGNPDAAVTSDYSGHETLRVNHQRMSILLKSSAISSKTVKWIGSATGRVYSSVLRLVEKEITSWPKIESDVAEGASTVEYPRVSTQAILADLDTIEGLAEGIASADEVDKLRARSRKGQGSINGDGTGASDRHAVGSDEDVDINETIDGTESFKIVRQHLLLLAEHPTEFLDHHPRGPSGIESWSVPLTTISAALRLRTILEVVETRFGSPAVRLVNILNDKGKLDEKALSSLSLLNQKTMRAALAAMHSTGVLELQEVPRDNNRTPAKTMFLWFFDAQRASSKLLDETYKTMARFIQRLEKERDVVNEVLVKASRSDVVGREQDLLNKDELASLEGFEKKQLKTFAELNRLDDVVSVLKNE